VLAAAVAECPFPVMEYPVPNQEIGHILTKTTYMISPGKDPVEWS
jgi:hypothetical protein